MVFKNLLQLYALVVCAVTVVILLIFSGFFLNTLTDLLIPEYKEYAIMGRYASNDAYLKFRKKEAEQYLSGYEGGDAYSKFREKRYQDAESEIAALKLLPPQQLDEQRESDKREFLEKNKRTNIQYLIFYFQWIIVVAVFFYIHWRLYRKALSEAS